MTTLYPADPCIPPHPINMSKNAEQIDTSRVYVDETIRERLQCVLLRKALPWLVKTELSPSTCAELRDLIRQIEGMTRD